MNLANIKEILDAFPKDINQDELPDDFPVYQSQCRVCNSPGRPILDYLIAAGVPDRTVGRYVNANADFFGFSSKTGSALAVSIQRHRIKHTTTGRRPGRNKPAKVDNENTKLMKVPQSEKIVESMTDLQRYDLIATKGLAEVHAGIRTPTVTEATNALKEKRALLATNAQANIWSEMFKGQKLKNKKLEKELAPVIELDK